MREIKYKAWDKKDKVVRDVVGMSFYHESVSVDIEYGKYLQDDIKRFELIQYTGFKDKNGVEIYEGDIVSSPTQNNVIEYRYGAFMLIGLHKDKYERNYSDLSYYLLDSTTRNIDNSRFDGVTTTLEVIGNIHEQPHLVSSR